MAWTYSGDPSTSPKDEVRFIIGDTDSSDPQLSDGEIEYLLSEYGSPLAAAIPAIESLIAKYTRYADQRTGDISVSYSKLVDQYRALLSTIKDKLAAADALPYCGGISISDREIDEEDDDRVPPSFDKGFMDNI